MLKIYGSILRLLIINRNIVFSLCLPLSSAAVPSKPLNLTVVGVNGTSIRLSWIAPEHSNGAIQGYWIYYVYQNETLFKPCLKIDAATGTKIFYNLTNLRE